MHFSRSLLLALLILPLSAAAQDTLRVEEARKETDQEGNGTRAEKP